MKKTILIIDDNLVNRKLLVSSLEDDFEVIEAQSGLEGIEKTKEYKPNLILLDIDMPQMSGFEVCSELKNDNELSVIPIIFITGNDDTKSELKGLKIGAVDYITKPINVPIVQARVATQILLLELQEERDLKIKQLQKTIRVLESKMSREKPSKFINFRKKKTHEIEKLEDYVFDEHLIDLEEYEESMEGIINHLIIKGQMENKLLLELSSLFAQYAKILSFYPIFHDIGYGLNQLSNVLQKTDLEPTKENFAMSLECMESLVFTLVFWRKQVINKEIDNPNAYDNSIFSDIETITLSLTNSLDSVETEVEFFN